MRPPPPTTLFREFAVVTLAGSVLFTLLLVLVDNTNLLTTNGLWKSIPVAQWVEGRGHPIDESNLLYYPVNGLVLRLFPEAIFGPVWRRMAFLNAIWGGLSLGSLFVLLRGLGLGRFVAAMGVLFQAGCAFFLALAIGSEDSMAGVAFISASLAMAVVVARRPTVMGVAMVSLTFSAAWLFEWRMLFPMAPALVLAPLVFSGSARERGRLILVGLLAGLLLPVLIATVATVSGRADSVLSAVSRIVWTGKGLGTGWGGFRLSKLVFLEGGLGFYLFEGGHTGSLDWYRRPEVQLRLSAYLLVFGSLLSVLVHELRKRADDPAWRTAGVLLIGTFFFGEFFNLYSQPQDPQYQLNVILWIPLAWAICCRALLRRIHRRAVVAVLSVVPLAVNLACVAPRAGGDSLQLARVERLEELLDLDRTVFVEHGFEGLVTWRVVEWGEGWEAAPELGPAPQTEPVYKALFLTTQAIEFPNRAPQAAADSVGQYIDHALEMGFHVIMNETWAWSEEEMVSSFQTVSGPENPRAIFRMLKSRFRGEPFIDDPLVGRYYTLRQSGG